MTRVSFCKTFSPAFLLILWYALAAIISAPLILPYPHQVFLRLFQLAETVSFWQAFAFTFLRVIISFFISLTAGFFLGLIAADSKAFSAFLEFPLELLRATPVIALILPALFWFTSGIVPVFVAVMLCLPIIITASEKGFEKNQENIEKLFKAKSRGFCGFSAFIYIRLPSAMPALISGAQSAFGLAWKVVAAGEVLSIPHHAAGSLMQKAQVHLETCDVLAITFLLVFISWLLESAFRKIALLKISSKNHKKAL